MRVALFATVLSAAAATAGTAGACNLEDAGLAERHAALATERGELTAKAAAAFQQLYQAAAALDRLGFATGCDEVVDTALVLIENDAAWQVATAADTNGTVGGLNLEVLAARDGSVTASALVGQPLRTTDGRPVGTVADVLLDQGRDASHVLVDRGGFWGRGSRIAVPVARLLTEPEDLALYLEIDQAALANAPQWSGEWKAATNDQWYEDRTAEAVDATAIRASEARAAERAAADSVLEADPPVTAETAIRTDDGPGATITGGPKRLRVEKDRPERAEGSND